MPSEPSRPAGGLSRRRLLRDAAGASLALTVGAADTSVAGRRRRPRSRPTVAVLGGGVAGLTAAHELAERGFAVTVVEPYALGGKSRSIPAPHTGRRGRVDLPGEHGFRFFPGFYRNVPDTMRRIPYRSNPDGVLGNLVEPAQEAYAFASGSHVLVPRSPGGAHGIGTNLDLLGDLSAAAGIPDAERDHFARRILVFLTSSDERRVGQWEQTSWVDFVTEPGFSPAYRRVLADSAIRTAVAVRGQDASARTVGLMVEALSYTLMPQQSGYGAPDRILNAPTNEAWIDPWAAHLRRLGVRFVRGHPVRALELRRRRVSAALLGGRTARRIEAEWFVCAMPVERARRLVDRDVLAADPSLESLRRLRTEWMNGIQFFLRRPFARPTPGHVIHVDSLWALTSINQAQFWPHRRLARDYGDGRVRDILSVIISDWSTRGVRVRRPASACSAGEVARETWAQLKDHLDRPGEELADEMLLGWFLDPAIHPPAPGRRRAVNDTPLFANTVGSWNDRPDVATAIPNLLLASDYVRTDVDLASMEGANEAARRAVNALLERATSRARPARVHELYRPAEYERDRRIDAERYRAGLPNLLESAAPQPA